MASLGVQIIACADKGSAVAIKMVSVFLLLTVQSGLAGPDCQSTASTSEGL
jgi:hypothetical protein